MLPAVINEVQHVDVKLVLSKLHQNRNLMSSIFKIFIHFR